MYPSDHAHPPSRHLDDSISRVDAVWKGSTGGELVSNRSSPSSMLRGTVQTPSPVSELVWFASHHLVLHLLLFDLVNKTPAVSTVSLEGLWTGVLFQCYSPPLSSWCLHCSRYHMLECGSEWTVVLSSLFNGGSFLFSSLKHLFVSC